MSAREQRPRTPEPASDPRTATPAATEKQVENGETLAQSAKRQPVSMSVTQQSSTIGLWAHGAPAVLLRTRRTVRLARRARWSRASIEIGVTVEAQRLQGRRQKDSVRRSGEMTAERRRQPDDSSPGVRR